MHGLFDLYPPFHIFRHDNKNSKKIPQVKAYYAQKKRAGAKRKEHKKR